MAESDRDDSATLLVGRLIRSYRDDSRRNGRRLTQEGLLALMVEKGEDLAAYWDRSMISNWERGVRHPPREFLVAFGRALNVPQSEIDHIMALAGYENLSDEEGRDAILATELIEHMDSPSDVQVLTRHYLEQQPPTPAPLDSLSPAGRTAARLLNGVPSDEAEALYAMLPLAFREELILISPSTYVDDLRARLLIMHDRHDRYIPAAESRRLLEATQDRINVRYTEFIGFDHLLPDEDGVLTRLEQALKMYRHMYSILRIAS